MTTTREVPQVVKDLQAARDYLATHGWLQNQLYDSNDGSVCAVGAVQYGVPVQNWRGNDRFALAVHALDQAVRADWRTSLWSSIIYFNNEEGRTKEEVLALFDRAIARELGVPQLAEVR